MNQEYQKILEQVKNYAIDYLDSVGEKRAFPAQSQIDALKSFNEELPETGTNASEVIESLHRIGTCVGYNPVVIYSGKQKGPMVKWSRRRPLTAQSAVRIRLGSPKIRSA